MNLGACPVTPPATPRQLVKENKEDNVSVPISSPAPSSDEEFDYQEEEQEEAGFKIDYEAAGAMEFYAKPRSKRLRIKMNDSTK